jgi:malic enzyme
VYILLFGFTTEIYHDARSRERQRILIYFLKMREIWNSYDFPVLRFNVLEVTARRITEIMCGIAAIGHVTLVQIHYETRYLLHS